MSAENNFIEIPLYQTRLASTLQTSTELDYNTCTSTCTCATMQINSHVQDLTYSQVQNLTALHLAGLHLRGAAAPPHDKISPPLTKSRPP